MFIWMKGSARGREVATKRLKRLYDPSPEFVHTRIAWLSRNHACGIGGLGATKERQRAEREHLTRLLKESPGNRDARNFLKQFDIGKKSEINSKSQVGQAVQTRPHEWKPVRAGVNLGNLYQPTGPLDVKESRNEKNSAEPAHLALVKLRHPQILDDQTLASIASTLGQLGQLGLSTVVVLDHDEDAGLHPRTSSLVTESGFREQAVRVRAALEDYNEPGALLVDHALSYSDSTDAAQGTEQIPMGVKVQNSNLIYHPIDNGMIVIVSPFAYDKDLKRKKVQADDIVLALVREFSGIVQHINQYSMSEDDSALDQAHDWNSKNPILDRIIILDPLGGIPCRYRADGAHVFVNLQAEYLDVREELQRLSRIKANGEHAEALSPTENNSLSFMEDEALFAPLVKALESDRHIKNLDIVEQALKLLPPSSSGLILTPAEAGTRSKNPLLHNLLTDRPMISSSLPTSSSRISDPVASNPATFLKKGISLTILPDPHTGGRWRPPSATNSGIDLAKDPRINLAKLVDLINLSFRRKLDTKAYLDRIRGRLAGIIIAGDYEGGAICTWERPSLLTNQTSVPETTSHSTCWVPYLDKFVVLPSSQGSGGVSDIVWAALTRTCFPDDLLWRSRTNNPVNKWYQERAKGMWNLPGDEWTMFWTSKGIDQPAIPKSNSGEIIEDAREESSVTKWDAYIDICSNIRPSWISTGS